MSEFNKPRVTVRIDDREVDLDAWQANQREPRSCWRILGFFVGLIVVSAVIVGITVALLSSIVADFSLEAFLRGDMSFGLGPQQQSIENPAAFDPIAMLPTAQAMADEGAQLLGIDMRFVRADGTMDLTATYNPAPSTTYTFMIEVPPPPDAPPVGVGGYTGGNFYQRVEVIAERPGQTRRVVETTGNARIEYTYITQGLRRDPSLPSASALGQPVSLPTCSLAALWEEAIRRDAPRDAVATIIYDQNGYRFSIQGVILLRFNADCTPTN